jgi:transcriptional regulator with XRE-family HTH domain
MMSCNDVTANEKPEISRAVTAALSRSNSCRTAIPSRLEQVNLAQAVGKRLREAREIAGYSQQVAAQRLGYQNSSKLARIESGHDAGRAAAHIPLWVIYRAAEVYGVSIDYLFGLTETMEIDEDRCQAARDMVVLMREEWERQRWRDVVATRAILDRVKTLESMISVLAGEAADLATAMQRVEELNPESWQEMRGGSKLKIGVERVTATVRATEARLRRINQEARAATGAKVQLDLVFI